MDHSIERVKGAKFVNLAISLIYEAEDAARSANARKLQAQLENLAEELIYLHREFLNLPPQRTPAGQEFSQADLGDEGTPF